jgi:cbb3-type cytochrome oxidase subunit 3
VSSGAFSFLFALVFIFSMCMYVWSLNKQKKDTNRGEIRKSANNIHRHFTQQNATKAMLLCCPTPPKETFGCPGPSQLRVQKIDIM